MFHAERNVQALASAGARLSKALGIPYAPESYVLGVLCSDLDPAKHESLESLLEAIKRLAGRVRSTDPDD